MSNNIDSLLEKEEKGNFILDKNILQYLELRC